MSVKCSICKKAIETTFLKKIIGTYVNKKAVCSSCQKVYKEKIKDML